VATGSRQKSLIVPREHGAWGILLVPLVTGAAAGLLKGGDGWQLAPLTIAALALFWLRTPVESWMGATPVRARAAAEIRLVRTAALILAAVSVCALLWLFWGWRNRTVLWIGAAAGIAFAGQAIVKQFRGRNARTAAQMIGAAGLTATAPAAFCAVTGKASPDAWFLWAANLLFAINQIHFVQLRIQTARPKSRREKFLAGRGFLANQLILILILCAVCGLGAFPWFGALAFLPVLWRGFAWFLTEPRPLAIHALGKSELLYACLFGVLLVIGMALGER